MDPLAMDPFEIRRMLAATGEEITDGDGHVIGYVAQPARFKTTKAYLALGGFLVVSREEETGEYIASEFDALPHPKTGVPYPAGHSAEVWRVCSLEEAFRGIMAYFANPGVE
jgi:hypothetical protein